MSLTANDIVGGKGIDCPPLRQVSQTFRKAPKKQQEHGQATLALDE